MFVLHVCLCFAMICLAFCPLLVSSRARSAGTTNELDPMMTMMSNEYVSCFILPAMAVFHSLNYLSKQLWLLMLVLSLLELELELWHHPNLLSIPLPMLWSSVDTVTMELISSSTHSQSAYIDTQPNPNTWANNECDSNADTCCLGTNFIIAHYTTKTA